MEPSLLSLLRRSGYAAHAMPKAMTTSLSLDSGSVSPPRPSRREVHNPGFMRRYIETICRDSSFDLRHIKHEIMNKAFIKEAAESARMFEVLHDLYHGWT